MSTIRQFAVGAAILCCAASLAAAGTNSDFFAAARLGQVDTVAKLLDADAAMLHARSDAGETALHFAAAGHQADVVALLLNRGVALDAADAQGRTALHLAATASDARMVALLVAAGADLDARDAHGRTPLHVAARRMHRAPVEALLAAGADVNARDATGRTPLHVLGQTARHRGHVLAEWDLFTRLLIDAGADPDLTDQAGQPALHGPPADPLTDRGSYPSWSEVQQMMTDWANDYPSICELHIVGASVQGRPLLALNITDNPGVEEDEPEFKYVSTMHGDEWTCMVMCLNFIDLLLSNYGSDPTLTSYVDEIDIWVMPIMNPDGYVSVQRTNANYVDLNRNFPEGSGPNPDPNTTTGREAETAAVMNWTFANSFTLSANMHTGALVVNYPFDNDNMGSVFSPTPDEDLFVYISEQYSQHNLPMWNGDWFHGITNGAAWYSTTGCMQDWHYRYQGCNEVTLELSDTKRPSYALMPQFWDENRDSMLAYMATCLIGVRGIVTDAMTGDPVYATITVVGRDHPIYTDPDVGDYHRMLLPGTYQLRFAAAGYETVILPVTVNAGDATRLDVILGGPPELIGPDGGETLPANQVAEITWNGAPTTAFQVQYTANYGETGATTDDFEDGDIGPGYTMTGDGDWYITDTSKHSGVYAARSGAITHEQTTVMTRTVEGGPMSFWYRVSSEPNYDWFNFYVDGALRVHRSGNVWWTQYSETLAPGTHELKWEYTKDEGVSGYEDTIWIDDISFTGDATVWHDVVALTEIGATAADWTPTAPGDAYKVRVRTHFGSGNYSSWDESETTFSVTAPTGCAGDSNCDGSINWRDIDFFVAAQNDNEAAWTDLHLAVYGVAPDCPFANNDVDGSGSVNWRDIDPFVAVQNTTCP